MFEKFHYFVVPEDQHFWIYQDPPSEYIKLANETFKKGKN